MEVYTTYVGLLQALLVLGCVLDIHTMLNVVLSYFIAVGTSDFPGMYAQSLRVQPEDCRYTFQANHKCFCYSYHVILLANSLNSNMSVSTAFVIYACLKGSIMVIQ